MDPEPRRTQEQRREHTRAALLDAALACLCERGLGRLTTPEVAARAELSQGALFRYFPTKAALLAATSEHLFAELSQDYELRFARLPRARRTLRTAVRLLARSMEDPRLAAAFELYTAARTDPDLQAALDPVVRAHVAQLRSLAASLFPRPATEAPKAFTAFVDLAVLAMQGLVLEELALPDPSTRRRLLATLEELALRVSPDG